VILLWRIARRMGFAYARVVRLTVLALGLLAFSDVAPRCGKRTPHPPPPGPPPVLVAADAGASPDGGAADARDAGALKK
jgi:hypothetical protein